MHKIDINMTVIIQETVFVYRLKNIKDLKWHTRYHSHGLNLYEIHYFISGEGKFRIGRNLYNIIPGMLFICPPDLPHAVETTINDQPITYYAVLFSINSQDCSEADGVQSLLDKLISGLPVKIGRNYRFFFEELKERSMSVSTMKRNAAVFQLLSFLYILGDGDIPEGEPGNIHIEKALDIMQENIYGYLTLEDIAGKINVTSSYLSRLFKNKLNTAPKKYYTRLKIEAAAALLTDTNMSIYEIAEKLKFYSEYHFSRVFKQYTGLPPGKYRKEQYYRHKNEGERIIERNGV